VKYVQIINQSDLITTSEYILYRVIFCEIHQKTHINSKTFTKAKLNFFLKQLDFDGNYEYSDKITVELGELVKEYKLEQNYPNPFNPSTEIKFSIPQNSNVKLELFNMLGEKVATLINQEMTAGSHNYQLSISNYQLSSGIYLYKLQSGNFVQTRKLMLIK